MAAWIGKLGWRQAIRLVIQSFKVQILPYHSLSGSDDLATRWMSNIA